MIQIQWTAPHRDEAEKICRALVEERLVACAQLIPHITSIYRWNGKVETNEEVKVILKTIALFFPKVEAYILEHCSYAVPEIAKIVLDEVHAPYEAWAKKQLEGN